MSDLTVTPAEVTSASQGIRSAADTLDDRVRALTTRVEALLNGGWKGQAADAFRRDWQQWLHGAKDVVGGLDSMAALLASNARQHDLQRAFGSRCPHLTHRKAGRLVRDGRIRQRRHRMGTQL
ncbi:WXG100 family type VII secretion target [Williamsia sp. CHRR-6]|uniref:WXG100 family type VII secretion target n=1 Tax=Williamsia sp. CHRR-6 TaxID=2835871 RepID=UPI001BDAE14D|nr:WXG100 family type VII secretion target [Williamsia sp. CHRR-6]MBT0566055.1 WXG100 family type VII secretion target [Williamsia sp. CHRR-6]